MRNGSPPAPEWPRSSADFRTFERIALAAGALINRTRPGKLLQTLFLRSLGYIWMRRVLSRWLLVEGMERLVTLDPAGGVLLVANHRSFFDFYVISTAVFSARTPWLDRVYFPVRAEFFYERPAGLLINLLAGAGAMYPPIYPQRSRAQANKRALRELASFLDTRGSMVGLHPEGARNLSAHPYQLLPFKRGTADLALQTDAVVVPVFVNGLSNDFLGDVRRGMSDAGASSPCICVFGEPLSLQDLRREPLDNRVAGRALEMMRASIEALGEEEKALREACEAGEIQAADPRWLRNFPGSRLIATKARPGR